MAIPIAAFVTSVGPQVINLHKGRCGMITNRPLRIASSTATVWLAVWLAMFMALPAARAQSRKHPPAAAAAATSSAATIKYVCFSTDPKHPTVYLSEIFDVPDAGSQADNFIAYERAKIAFQLHLVDSYNYSGDDDMVDCRYAPTATTPNATAVMASMKQSMTAQAVSAKKRVVETGWRLTKTASTSAPASTGGQASGNQVAPQAAPSRSASETSGTVFKWHMEKTTDALSDESSTQPASMKIISGANGKPQGLVSVRAYCSSNGVSVFFLADVADGAAKPSFPWYDDASRSDDDATQITDVRLRVDDRPVHVAQGFPEVDGHQVYTNTVGLLFYEPHTEARAVAAQERRVTTGVPALDGLLGGIVKQTAQNNAETWQSNSAGPLSDLVGARSIRVELPVTTFDPKPLLDLNPQDPVLHKFVSDCNAKFTR